MNLDFLITFLTWYHFDGFFTCFLHRGTFFLVLASLIGSSFFRDRTTMFSFGQICTVLEDSGGEGHFWLNGLDAEIRSLNKCLKESDARFKASKNDLVGDGTEVGGCRTDLFWVRGGVEGWGGECRGGGASLAGNWAAKTSSETVSGAIVSKSFQHSFMSFDMSSNCKEH